MFYQGTFYMSRGDICAVPVPAPPVTIVARCMAMPVAIAVTWPASIAVSTRLVATSVTVTHQANLIQVRFDAALRGQAVRHRRRGFRGRKNAESGKSNKGE